MHGVALQFLGRLDNGLDIKVRIKRVLAVVWIGDVRHLNRQGKTVLSAVDDGHFDAHVPQGSENAEGDFSTVSDEDALESHGYPASEAIYEESGPGATRVGFSRVETVVMCMTDCTLQDDLLKHLVVIVKPSEHIQTNYNLGRI